MLELPIFSPLPLQNVIFLLNDIIYTSGVKNNRSIHLIFQALQPQILNQSTGKYVPYIFMEWANLRLNRHHTCDKYQEFIDSFTNSDYSPYEPGSLAPVKLSTHTDWFDVVWIHKDAVKIAVWKVFELPVFVPPTQIVEIQRTLLALELLCCEDCFQPTLSHYLIKTQRTATGITKQKNTHDMSIDKLLQFSISNYGLFFYLDMEFLGLFDVFVDF